MRGVMLKGKNMVDRESYEVFKAIIKGEVEKLDAYVNQGFDIKARTEKEKWTRLHMATRAIRKPINLDSLKYLINSGIDLNAQDMYGNTALHYAAAKKDPEAIKILLEAGSEVDIENRDGITPLHQSLLKNPKSLEATEALLIAGANPDRNLRTEGRTIRGLVEIIAHGENEFLKSLFDRY